MRVLLLFRGAPGCGKSTFIKEHGLEQYTLSADDIRLKYSSPILGLNPNAQYTINQKLDRFVWEDLFRILEMRMQNGDFTVIDATNSKAEEMNRYKKLASDYKYRIFMVDMTSVPIEVAKERNRSRLSQGAVYKYVPEEAIDKMYARFRTQKIPSGIKVLPYIDGQCDLSPVIQYCPMEIDAQQYKKVVHIGDIHGCYTTLQDYLKGTLEDDVFYIFTGDYIDRGLENREVMEFILANYTKPNVIFLEGNHERWLFDYAKCNAAKSKEFELRTKPQLEGLDKAELQRFYRKLVQVSYYTYANKRVLVTHGGLPYLANIENKLIFIPTEQLIKGVGTYNDAQLVDNQWNEKAECNFISVHGHRNMTQATIQSGEQTYNLEGQVEFGGNLRIMELYADGSIKTVEIMNTTYRKPNIERDLDVIKGDVSIGQLVDELRKDKKYITEKRFGNISSFNFNPKAFYEGKWNARTEKARGLYINTLTNKIVARGYDKFFKVGEMKETSLDALSKTMTFPAIAYTKENGYLGLISYNAETNDLFITTKSNPDGIYAQWFKDQLYSELTQEQLDIIKNYCKDNDVTLLFEVIDMEHDPHIIEYPENSLCLLTAVKNTIEFEQIPYEKLKQLYFKLTDGIGVYRLYLKEKYTVLNEWKDFVEFYNTVSDQRFNPDNPLEGFVIEDANGYMIKIKTDFYNFWKRMRSIVPTVFKQGYITGTSMLYDDRSNNFYGFLKNIYQKYERDTTTKMAGWNIIKLRKEFEIQDKNQNSVFQ